MAPRLPIAILGCGGHARVVAEACTRAGLALAGFVGPAAAGPGALPAPVLGDDRLLDDAAFVAGHAFVVGIGDQATRTRLAGVVQARDGALATVIHPFTSIAAGTPIGEGSVVLAGAVVNVGAEVGRRVILHSNASVDHDGRIADGVQICPGAALAGDVTCGTDAFIGTGASVVQGIRIGAGAIVGAGAVVTEDVPAGVTVVGNPARPK